MKITNLTQQKIDENRVNVFIDGVYSFSLSLQEVLDEKIKIGVECTAEDIDRLKKVSADGKVKSRMIEWLSLRPRSEKELQQYLKKKSVEPELVNSLMLLAKKYNLQNEEHFTKWWIEQRIRKQRSIRYIKNELRGKGVSNDIIEASFVEHVSEDKVQLKKLIEKKRHQSRYSDEQKLKEYLLRQGYRYSDIEEALAE